MASASASHHFEKIRCNGFSKHKNKKSDRGIVKNVYSLHVNNFAKKFHTDHQRYIEFRKQERNKSHNKLDELDVEVNEFNDSMTKHAYDIRTKDKFYQRNRSI